MRYSQDKDINKAAAIAIKSKRWTFHTGGKHHYLKHISGVKVRFSGSPHDGSASINFRRDLKRIDERLDL